MVDVVTVFVKYLSICTPKFFTSRHSLVTVLPTLTDTVRTSLNLALNFSEFRANQSNSRDSSLSRRLIMSEMFCFRPDIQIWVSSANDTSLVLSVYTVQIQFIGEDRKQQTGQWPTLINCSVRKWSRHNFDPVFRSDFHLLSVVLEVISEPVIFDTVQQQFLQEFRIWDDVKAFWTI